MRLGLGMHIDTNCYICPTNIASYLPRNGKDKTIITTPGISVFNTYENIH